MKPIPLYGDLPPKSPLRAMSERNDKKPDDAELSILHDLPLRDFAGYYTVFEFDQIPKEWYPYLKTAQIIFTSSQFCKDCFVSSGIEPEKIFVAPHPLADSMVPEGDGYKKWTIIKDDKQRQFEAHTKPFVFLSTFEWVPRKVPHLMLQAFHEEFTKDEDVVFAIRAWSAAHIPVAKLINSVSDDRIFLMKRIVPEMDKLYKAADAYVSCSAGEGFGLTLAEAMACGIPTIASNHSGNLEFMRKDNSWLVDVDDWSLIGNEGAGSWAHPYMKWRKPKVDSIRKQMRLVYDTFKDKPRVEVLKNPRISRAVEITQTILDIKAIGQKMRTGIDWWWQKHVGQR